VNPFFDGAAVPEITRAEESILPAHKRDTITYAILIDPHGFSGVLKNWVTGSAEINPGVFAADSSNNGFVWDTNGDGDPRNDNVVTLIEINPVDLFIPEGFSPNDDGKYDLFQITGLNERAVTFTVYNRWGNKVCVKEGREISWDGRSNVNAVQFGNDKVPQGTYYYVLEFSDGKTESLHGFLQLLY